MDTGGALSGDYGTGLVVYNDFSPGVPLAGRRKVDYPALFETLRTGYKDPLIEVWNNFDHYDELAVARDFLMAAGKGSSHA